MLRVSFSLLVIAVVCFAQAPDAVVKPATETTRRVNDRARQQMHLDDKRDFAEARRGWIAPLPNGGVVRDAAGNTVMDAGSFAFVENGAAAPDSVNPGLWRQSQLECETGLFQVIDRIYQVRGYDISGITFIEGDTGVIVVDPLTTAEAAAAAADLYFGHRPKRPVTEAPAEMHFYIPELKALCTAENATHTLHNLYTLRGAKTRDALKWVGYLNETIDLWGRKAEVLFAPHNWPVWGKTRVVEHLEKYRDTIRYIHDQTLRLANQGYTMDEIAEQLQLPAVLAENASSRGYYGTVGHNSKAVYNFYLGYFDGNPAHLNPLPPEDAAKKYVEFMGGPEETIRKARLAFDRGEYRWVAEVVNHVVFAFPENRAAKELEADALEQLGFQAESGPWRNFYLTGASELRGGVKRPRVTLLSVIEASGAMPVEMLLDYLAIQLNGPKAEGKTLRVALNFSDTGERHLLALQNSVLNHWKDRPGAECTVTLTRAQLSSILADHANLPELRIEGRRESFQELLALLDPFDPWFNIVTP
jgi:alkyl sulfatase BDS1-like metallo-beta-lactamase superfamily hydrolase